MQRIFDIENKEDMADLWAILPDEAYSIKKSMGCQTWRRKGEDTGYYFEFVKINWHDKTEITRPVNCEDMIGCVGWFSDNIDDKKAHLGILKAVSEDGFKYKGELHDWWFEYFTPVKKSELKFYGEQDD